MRRIGIALAGALAAACAALTVDVDVYKGPLTDDKDVLVEEFASMAVGARHLLIQLRNLLERQGIERLPRSKQSEPKDKLDRNKDHDYWFESPASDDAAAVNAILSLYRNKEDLGSASPLLAGLLERIRTVFQEARESCEVLRTTDSDLRLIDVQLGNAFTQQGRDLRSVFPSAGWVNLRQVAERFDPDDKLPVHLRFEALADEDKVLEVLGIGRGADPELFERLQGISLAFLALRRNYAEGLDLCLRFIEAAAIDSSLKNRQDAIQEASEIVGAIIQPRFLVVALSDDRIRKLAGPVLLEQLSSRARALGASNLEEMASWRKEGEGASVWTKSVVEQMASAVKTALVLDPVATALQLRNIHVEFQGRASVAEIALEKDKHLRHPRAREYGIARAAALTNEEVEQIESAIDTLHHLERSIQGYGLQDGRIDEGLVTLIEVYLGETNEERKKVHLTRLTDALVAFAEKILFVVNNDFILRACEGTDDCRENYVMVLQSIGNSILSLANDQRAREAFEERSKAEEPVETAALTRAWNLDPEQWIADLLRRIGDDAAEGSRVLLPEVEEKRTASAKLEAAEKTVREKEGTAQKAADQAKKDLEAFEAIRASWTRPEVLAVVQSWKAATESGKPTDVERLKALLAGLERKRIELRNANPSDDAPQAVVAALAKDLEAREKEKVLEGSSDRDTVQSRLIDLQAKTWAQKGEQASGRRGEAEDLGKQLGKLAAELENAKKALAEEEKGLADAKKARKDLRAQTAKAIEDKRDEFVGKVRGAETPVDPATYDSILLGLLGPDDKTAKLLAAYGVSTHVDPAIAALAASRKDVLDALAASLRHMHVEEVAHAGNGSARARELQAALDLTLAYRSQAIHLTTPATYLRQSYAVSSLQDTSVGWRHELAAQLDRALPIGKSGDRARRQRIQQEIDRQHWQSINRIRVAGLGKTSYVIVKDDIGNWYVKSYVSDPKSVIQGAKALALAGVSQSLGADAFARERTVLAGNGAAAAPSTTTLGKQLVFYSAEYARATEKDAQELRAALNQRGVAVKEAWRKLSDWGDDGLKLALSRDDLEKDLDDVLASRPPFPAPLKDTASAEDRAKHCLELLDWALDLQEAWLAKFEAKRLVPLQELEKARSDRDAAQGAERAARETVSCAEKELDLARRMAALPGVPPAVAEEVTTKEQALALARAELEKRARESEVVSKALAAAEALDARRRSFVDAMRNAIREATDGVAKPFLLRRNEAVRQYRTALDVLGRVARSR